MCHDPKKDKGQCILPLYTVVWFGHGRLFVVWLEPQKKEKISTYLEACFTRQLEISNPMPTVMSETRVLTGR